MKTLFVLGAIFTSLIAMSCSNQESLDGMLTESQSLSASHRYGIPCNSNVITKDDAAFVADKFMEHPTQAEEYNMKQLIFIIQMGIK